MKRKINKKNTSIVTIILGLILVIVVNIFSSFVFHRWDLTAEKRYTLSKPTLELLKGLDDYVYFKVMLNSKDLPVGFQRLKQETKEMLDEFRAHSKYIEFEFIDPTKSDDPDMVNASMQELVDAGLSPTKIFVETKTGSTQQIIFPGALLSYKERTVPVQLLTTQIGVNSDEVINNSIQSLEYSLSNAIRKVSNIRKNKIAILDDYGCLDQENIMAFTALMQEYYDVTFVKLDGQLNSLANIHSKGEDTVEMSNKYTALIIPGPTKPVSEQDKFVIDQYIMRGGKVLWLVEPVYVTMDSLQSAPSTYVFENHHNLKDQLFNYGVRLEPMLIMDLQCLDIPLLTGNIAGRPQIQMFPWVFFPIITPLSNHPIVNNLNALKTEFVSPITPLAVQGIKQTVLLHSSPYSRLFMTPDEVSLEILTQKPNADLYQKLDIPIMVLLEGKFKSLYDNRIPPELMDNPLIDFKKESVENSMIVISDADMIRNQFRSGDGAPLNLGFDQYTGIQFGNPELFINIMNYLCDDSHLISVRSRELKIRMLDNNKIVQNSLKIQIFNLLIPSLIVVICGIIYNIFRRRRYVLK